MIAVLNRTSAGAGLTETERPNRLAENRGGFAMIRSRMLRGSTAALAAVLVFLNGAPSSSQQASPEAAKLLGKWVSQMEFGELALEFRSATQLVFEGEPASYRLLPGVIRIEDEEGMADYRYSFRGEVLVLSFPEGFELEFRRVGGPPKAPVEKPAAEGPSPAPAAPPGTTQVGDPSWGFAFQPPAGWKFEKSAAAVILGHDSIAGMILVLPHQATTLEEVQRQMQEGLDEEGFERGTLSVGERVRALHEDHVGHVDATV